MICQRIGGPAISTIGFGRAPVSSEIRVPRPPARMTTFMTAFYPDIAKNWHNCVARTINLYIKCNPMLQIRCVHEGLGSDGDVMRRKALKVMRIEAATHKRLPASGDRM